MTFSLALASVSATPTHLKLPSASRRKISKAGSNALSFLPWGQEGVQLGLRVRVAPMGRFQQQAFQSRQEAQQTRPRHLPELNRGSSVPRYRLGSPLYCRSTVRGA